MKKALIVCLMILAVCASLFAKPENSFRNLDAKDRYGKRVTAEIFKDYDLTLVNFFVPWCYACHGEIRDLGQLYERLPSNINMVMICPDVDSDPDAFADMVSRLGVDLTVLVMTEKEALKYYDVLGYPTMCYVDRNGNILGVNFGGASISTIYLEEADKLIKKMNLSK